MTPWFLLALALIVLTVLWQRHRALQREQFIRRFELPRGLFDRLRRHHPTLTPKDCQLVAQALRQFFMAHLKSGRRYVSMPSQVADDLWHEFILYTRHYEQFCRQAFGRFLHHTPAVVLSSDRQANEGLRRCFWFSCRDENIDPRTPTRLPLLFALDAKLRIDGGHLYALDCSGLQERRRDGDGGGGIVHCGGDFSDASFDGGTDGFGDGDGGGGGDGGGCGGGE